MKPYKILVLTFLVAAAGALLAFNRADDDPIKKIVTQLQKWSDEYPQEKVYLHMDKPFYASGEDIWFRAYVLVGPKHQLSALSKILNVELINERDSVKKALKLPVYQGIAWGDFALPDSLPAGNYRIRAYTNYMRNAGDEYFFDKTFTIGNAITNNIYTSASYRYATDNGQQKVNADITYADIDGKPYAAKDVSYAVQLDMRDIAKGHGTTDDKGVLHVSFVNAMPNLFKAGRITTSIKYADKKSATQIVPVKAASGKVDVQFFPESGTLVSGLRTRVAFKATGADGLGVEVKGTITDGDNNEAARLSSQHLGMGVFGLTPEAGKTYKAVLTFADGSQSTVPLPAVTQSGYSMSVASIGDNLQVKVIISPDLVQSGAAKGISVIAQQNGVVCYAAKSSAATEVFAASVPKSRFRSGIVQFTLFSPNTDPLAERLTFVQNDDLLNIGISTDKQTYAPREKVKINLNTTDDGKPVAGTLSAAVIDETKVPADESDETTILSSILLSSDLKGYIEKPNYYFTNVSDKTRADLDLLMMTQGYRRFVWKQILNDVFPQLAFTPEKSLAISGTIKKGKNAVPRAKVMLISTGGQTMILDTVADEQGHFAFNNLVFTDSVKFAVQARTDKGKKDVDIELDNIGRPAISRNKNYPDVQISVSSVMSNYLVNSKNLYREQVKYGIGDHVTMLKEVVIAEKKKPLENSSNLNGPGNADQVIKADALSTCATLDICLQGLITGVLFRNGVPYSTRSMNTPMLIVLDGMYVDSDYLTMISPSDVGSIEVLRTAFTTSIYGSRGGGGVLIINTKRGNEGGNSYVSYAPGIMAYKPLGYYKSREFYSPQYDDPKANKQMADLRTTIFWAPNVMADKDGHGTFSFYNADSKGTYKVVVEGVNNEGSIGRAVYRYKVE